MNIFEKYGIKEVANVQFIALEAGDGYAAGQPVLFLDTLKVSTIETSAENVAAQGGWGNPKLVSWDYGKEINLTLEDALISFASLKMMLGASLKTPDENTSILVHMSEQAAVVAEGTMPVIRDHLDSSIIYKDVDSARDFYFINASTGYQGKLLTELHKGDIVRFFWTQEVVAEDEAMDAVELTISPNTFPGTYMIVGETFIRNENGKDSPFQFVIGKAKVISNVTITLQAEGDPSTFEMTINVLRSTNERGENEMMKLVKYGATAKEITATAAEEEDNPELGD